jgi:hypothetical protein
MVKRSDAPNARRPSMPLKVSRVEPPEGPSAREVRSKKLRTMEFNDLGWRAFFLGIAAVGLMALGWYFGAHLFRIDAVAVMYILAGWSGWFGVRGYSAAVRGLATNKWVSIAGLTLATAAIIGESIVLLSGFEGFYRHAGA